MKKRNTYILHFLLTFLVFWTEALYSQENHDSIRIEDKIRIREARMMSDQLKSRLWNGWNETPFAILLVTDENEYLMFHETPTEDFKMFMFDTLLNTNIYIRQRKFSNNFLATFPAVNGVPTIVVGIPENTSRSSNDWVNTLLHEHLHQVQSSYPDYYDAVKKLDLAGDDNSGMWMLNYDFPYDNEVVSSQYGNLTLAAKNAVLAIDNDDFNGKFGTYIDEREKFRSILDTGDYKYFSFQLWQEGLARYTELKIAEIMAEEYTPSEEFRSLNDYLNPDSFYVNIKDKLLRKAESQILSNDKRNCFYTLGALEGLILDRKAPGWRDDYFVNKFFIEEYYK